ncbi:MAG: hypothetical protein C4326_00445 [Ignavibacteria bacterium]
MKEQCEAYSPTTNKRVVGHQASERGNGPMRGDDGHFLNALIDPDESVRRATIDTFVRVGGEHAAAAVVQGIASPDEAVRTAVAEVLIMLGPPAFPPLRPYLQHTDCSVRKVAVEICGLLNHPECLASLAPLLRDEDPAVVHSTIAALGTACGEAALPHLIRLYDEDEYARPSIIATVGSMESEAARNFLFTCFAEAVTAESHDPLTLFGILEVLGRTGDEHVYAFLDSQLEHTPPAVRVRMLAAMMWIADRAGIQMTFSHASQDDVIRLLSDSDLRVRLHAVNVLAPDTDPTVTEAFLHALGTSEYLDAVLVNLLERRDDAFPTAIANLLSPSFTKKKELIVLLRALVKRSRENTELFYPRELLVSAFDSVASQWDVSGEGIRPLILETLFTIDGERACKLLHEWMKCEDSLMRMRLVELAGSLDDARATEFAAHYVEDEDELVRSAVQLVLQSPKNSSS